MHASWVNRCRLGLALFVGFSLALPGLLRADEVNYLPNGCVMLMSADLAAFMKSKTFTEAKNKLQGFEETFNHERDPQFGIHPSNVARVTLAVTLDGERQSELTILTTEKPIMAAQIKADRKVPEYMTNFSYKEIKVGAFTIYQDSYQYRFDKDDKPGRIIDGQAFCVVEGKLVLHGQLKTIRGILERNKPALSPGVEAGLNQTGLANTVTIIFDIENITAKDRKKLAKHLGEFAPGVAEVIDRVKVLTVRLNGDDQAKGIATVTCKDAASAANVKKVADDALTRIKGIAKDDPNEEMQFRAAMKGLQTLLGAVKTSTNGTQAQAEATVDASTVAAVLGSMFGTKAKTKEGKKGDEAK